MSFWSGNKLSAQSWDCNGDEDVQYIVAEETGEGVLELNANFLGDAKFITILPQGVMQMII